MLTDCYFRSRDIIYCCLCIVNIFPRNGLITVPGIPF